MRLLDDDGYASEDNLVERPTLSLAYDLCAYFYGLALSDGSIRRNERNSGALSIELQHSDQSVLMYLEEALPWSGRLSWRTRSSVFNGKEHRTCALVFHGKQLTDQLIAFGFPIGAKAEICAPPTCDYDAAGFWRGFLDGDGSIGVTSQGLPFISLVTKSEAIAEAYKSFVEPLAGYRPAVNRNQRDGVWNIMVSRQKAVPVVRAIYGSGAISIHRKQEAAEMIMAGDWQRDAPWRRGKKSSGADPGTASELAGAAGEHK